MSSACSYDQLLFLVEERRSVRHFKPDPLPDGRVEKMIEVARWAPSGFHSQPWEFMVIRDLSVKQQIAAAVSTGPAAPAMRDESDPSRLKRVPGVADARP